MWAILGSILTNPQALAAILGILGSLTGWWVKRWLQKQADNAAIIQKQKAEQDLADALTKRNLEDAIRVNEGISKVDQSAEDWLSKP